MEVNNGKEFDGMEKIEVQSNQKVIDLFIILISFSFFSFFYSFSPLYLLIVAFFKHNCRCQSRNSFFQKRALTE